MDLTRIILRIVKTAIFKMDNFNNVACPSWFEVTNIYKEDELHPFINAVHRVPLIFVYNHESDERKVHVKSIDYKENGTLDIKIDKDELKSKFPELFKE